MQCFLRLEASTNNGEMITKPYLGRCWGIENRGGGGGGGIL